MVGRFSSVAIRNGQFNTLSKHMNDFIVFLTGHVEPWRVMMSLKSGLLAESTWALDTLNILLHDDRTVGFFYLKHHHSLLQTLIDHFKTSLLAIFEENFEILPKYLPGREGAELVPCTTEGEVKVEEERVAEWLLRANEMDCDVLSDVKSATVGNDRGEKNMETEESTNGSTVPVASVFSFGRMRLGESDDLSHIRNPSIHDDLFYPLEDGGPEIMPESERRELERKSKLQRIDQTPVAELLHREALLSQVPLHRFGRLGRSPRRREKSFLEDIQMREEILKELEGDQRMESDSKNAECESKKTDLASSRSNGSSKTVAPNSDDSPKSPTLLIEESEVYRKEPLPLWSISPVRELLQGRCLCISNILRSLSFIPGNDLEFSQNPGILILLGRLLTLHHCHLLRSKEHHLHTVVDLKQKEDAIIADTRGAQIASGREEKDKQCTADVEEALSHNEEEEMESVADEEQKFALPCKENEHAADLGKPEEPTHVVYRDYWWWECLEVLRENTLVILSNISGQLDLSLFPESISYPIVDGLLHWAVCPCAHAVDPLPETAMVFSLSPQRLVLETLAKMSISEVNVDFILATPPLMRLDLLFSHLVQFIGQKKHPVMRQFALVLLSNMAQGNESASRLIGQQKMVVFLLLECIEIAEHASCLSGGQLVGGHNPDDPNSLSVAMLRRAATTLHCLSKVPANRTAFLPYRDRMLYLATSQYVEPSVSSILMDMLFELGKL